MRAANKDNWKQKYSQLLRESEAGAQKQEKQLQIVHRALLRSLLAAQGQDPALDTMLDSIRKDLPQLIQQSSGNNLLEQLEPALLKSESIQQHRNQQLQRAC